MIYMTALVLGHYKACYKVVHAKYMMKKMVKRPRALENAI